MGDMGMEDMAGGDMEVEGEAEVVDLEVVVAEDSEDDGEEFSGNFAYLWAFWADTRDYLYYEWPKRNKLRFFSELSFYSSKTSYSKSPAFNSYSGNVAGPQAPVPNP